MRILTNPTHFTFTNHFNTSLLKTRIEMMNRQSSWRSGWRYLALGMAFFFTVMCQNIPETPETTGSRYLISEGGKLFGVITPYATDKDISIISKTLAQHNVPFQLLGVQRDTAGRIVQIKEVVLGEYGNEATKVIKKRNSLFRFKAAFFDFCYDPEFGVYPNIHPKDFPDVLFETLAQEGVFSSGSIAKQLWYDPIFKQKIRRNMTARGIDAEIERTWSGNRIQLLEASLHKDKQAMVYVRSDNYLDLYEEYRKSVTIFLDQKEVTLAELNRVHSRDIAKIYAHKRSTDKNISVTNNRQATDTDHVIWIERSHNPLKRNLSY